VQAAPVRVSKAHLAVAEPQAVVVNAGVANAATGERGELDALATAADAALLLDLRVEEVVVLSTGVIGVHLPLDRVRAGLEDAACALSSEGGADAAAAILTTDTRPKEAVAGAGGFVVGGMAKGSGMIHPALATMLAVVTTDYPLAPGEAEAFLRPEVEATFNRISVDGECSTNDAVVLLANGASHAARDDEAFAGALHEVCASLSRQVVDDGEGKTVLIEVRVTGAADEREAAAVARRVATSPLVKTAAFGRDPNWGRVLAAPGRRPGTVASPDGPTCHARVQRHPGVRGRRATRADPISRWSCRIQLDLGLGDRKPVPCLGPSRLRPDQRGLHDVSLVVIRSAAAPWPPRRGGDPASRETTSSSFTAPAADLRGDERRGSRCGS
jgi:glutamate N-acetyltransferase/amino-acid N-acetyltransferase